MGIAMKRLPAAVEQFVRAQQTIAITELWETNAESAASPYGSHWYRAVAAMLRSDRVAAKDSGFPNRTDINRICKEANFNQHFFERIAKLLVAAKVVQAERGHRYVEGANHDAFWKHRCKELTEIMRAAVLQLIQDDTGYRVWRPTMAIHASLIEFLILFFTSFCGRAIREDQLGNVMLEFCKLPVSDLRNLAAGAGLKKDDVSQYDWEHWLDENGQRNLLSALYTAEWACYDERQKIGWVFPSPMGLGLLGLGPLPEAPRLATEFKADSNLAIYAGAGVEIGSLTTLCRFCKIKRIDQLIEFQVDPKRLKELPSANTELRAALANLDPMPPSLSVALQTESSLGGKIGVRYCSALVKPATAEAVAAIRQHPGLKGYLEPGAPPGFLLVKPGSNPDNFLRRCQALGFEIESL
jgi:hypothetical protein